MKKELKAQLLKMDERDFRLLELSLSMAKGARNAKERFGVDDKYLCRRLEIPKAKLKGYLNCVYNYTIKDMAMQGAMWAELLKKEYEDNLEKNIKKNVTSVNTDID